MKVAVCYPSPDMVHADFTQALVLMALTASERHRLFLVNVKSSIVAQSRSGAVDVAARNGDDYILFLDSDMVFPKDTLDRLLAHNKDIVGATYIKRVHPYEILGKPLPGSPTPDVGQLAEYRLMPTGCLLIKMSVFQKLDRPWFRFDHKDGLIVGEDYDFCERARAAGFQIWCDTMLTREIGHIGQHVFRVPTT